MKFAMNGALIIGTMVRSAVGLMLVLVYVVWRGSQPCATPVQSARAALNQCTAASPPKPRPHPRWLLQDGANIEIAQEIGQDNMFIFGALDDRVPQVRAWPC